MINKIRNWLNNFLGVNARFESVWNRIEHVNSLGAETDRRRHLCHDGLKVAEKKIQALESRMNDIEKEIHDRVMPLEMSLADYKLIMIAIREHLNLKLKIEQVPDPSYVPPPVPMIKKYRVIDDTEPGLTEVVEIVSPVAGS